MTAKEAKEKTDETINELLNIIKIFWDKKI